MRRSRKSYGRYRGSRRGVGVLIPTLVILCAIAAGTLWFVNENMTFTREGSFFSFLEKKEDAESEKVEANLIIEEPEPVAEPEPEPVKTGDVRAYFVPIGTVKNAELFSGALASVPQNINTLVLEVKAEDGMLAFATESALGKAAEVSGESEALTSAITKARECGYRVALYMSAFKDNEAARKNQSFSARTENKIIWIDGTNVRWLSAYSEEARGYLTDIIGELSEFSPDEIIVSNISFPAVGKTELLFYEKELGKKGDALESFMKEARQAAGKIKLSAVYENYADRLLGESGQDAAVFEKNFDEVYVNEASGRWTLEGALSGISGAVMIKARADGEQFMVK
ncbi:MAG: hypothetical protein IKU65_01530 [Oscillospiraceae bacterium]|nr:hypothetical protein [Oscillospiraceae bacterium]